MKKILLLSVAMLCVILVSNAQDKKYSLGLGFGGASASGKDEAGDKESGFGLNFYLNGMYNVNISAGLEYNSNIAVIGDADITGVSLKVTKINGILAKGKYLFGDGKTRFFAGLMAGIYIIQPGGVSIDVGSGSPTLDIVFEKATVFGFAPEIGVQLGSFQLATSYHIPGKYKSDILGSNVEVSYTVWQFNIGWNIGFGG